MIAIVGRASVGKSTLLNRILEEKVSIVSPVPQTTRNRIRAILTEPRGQLVFLDTPGMHKAVSDLGRLMNRTARASIEGVDVVLLVFDASEAPGQEDEGWVRKLVVAGSACVAVLHKIDRGSRFEPAYRDLWARIAAEKGVDKVATWHAASALSGQGIDELVGTLFRAVPEGPLLFPADVLTDFPRKLFIADVIREKLFASLRQELPHSVAVEVDSIEEGEDPWKIAATIFVTKASQKGIVIGNKGRPLRRVREAAARELAETYGHPVELELWVRVEKNWTRNYWFLKRLGYAE